MSNDLRFRFSFYRFLPGWLTGGTASQQEEDSDEGERVLYSLNVMFDAFIERTRQGFLARFPDHAPDDAVAFFSRDRKLRRGILETRAQYNARLVAWLDDHRVRGNAFKLLEQIAAYLRNSGTTTTDYGKQLASEVSTDRSGNGNGLTPVSMVDGDFTDDTAGGTSVYSATFAAAGYLNGGHLSEMEIEGTTDNVTLSVWVKFTSASSMTVVGQYIGGASGWRIQSQSGNMTIILRSGAGRHQRNTTATFNDGAWHHVIARKVPGLDADTWDFRIDGATEASTTSLNDLVAGSTGAGLFQIAGNSSGGSLFTGQIDNFEKYDAYLTNNECDALFDAGPTDGSRLSTRTSLAGSWGIGEDAGIPGPEVIVRTVTNTGVWHTRDQLGALSRVVSSPDNWDWDGSPSSEWSRFWVIIYPPPGLWDQSEEWGDPDLWTSGVFGTADKTIGTSATPQQVVDIRNIISDWKPAGTQCEWIIIASDLSSFDPADTTTEPDGLWGNWGKIVGGQYVSSRLSTARYWKGPVSS